LFAGIGFPHAENVSIVAARRIAHDDDPPGELAEAENAWLAVLPALVLDLDGHPCENQERVLEIEPSLGQRAQPLGRVEGDAHRVIVATKTSRATGRARSRPGLLFEGLKEGVDDLRVELAAALGEERFARGVKVLSFERILLA
jgi:hypothetical protein